NWKHSVLLSVMSYRRDIYAHAVIKIIQRNLVKLFSQAMESNIFLKGRSICKRISMKFVWSGQIACLSIYTIVQAQEDFDPQV
ncbi:hypothetical protein C2S52_009420, partial [Perilla frutescens var. hirtella]